MKIAVLTSSIGSTQLLDPIPFDGVDYHAFVDYASDNSGWIKHPTVPFSVDTRYKNRRDAKVYKVLPFAFLPDYDYYFWIDSTHILEADPHEIIDTYLKESDVAVFKHNFKINIKNIYCTKIASKLVRTYTDKHGYKDLCSELLGKSISKTEQSSDWGGAVSYTHLTLPTNREV